MVVTSFVRDLGAVVEERNVGQERLEMFSPDMTCRRSFSQSASRLMRSPMARLGTSGKA